MTLRCLECGYEMKTTHAVIAIMAHDVDFYSGVLNQKIGESLGAKCPKCGIYDHWKDK